MRMVGDREEVMQAVELPKRNHSASALGAGKHWWQQHRIAHSENDGSWGFGHQNTAAEERWDWRIVGADRRGGHPVAATKEKVGDQNFYRVFQPLITEHFPKRWGWKRKSLVDKHWQNLRLIWDKLHHLTNQGALNLIRMLKRLVTDWVGAAELNQLAEQQGKDR